MTASNPTLADKVRGLKIDHSVHCMNVRANAAFVEVFGGACACDAADHNARVESIAAEAERAPVMGEVRGMAEEALRLDAERMTPRLKLQVFEADDGATWRRLATALARALLAAPVAPVTEGEALRELERATRAIFHFVPFGRHRDDLKVALARLDATRTEPKAPTGEE